jgi:hypothetical protein
MTKREDIQSELVKLRTAEQAKEAYKLAPRRVRHYYLKRWYDLSVAEIDRARTVTEAETAFAGRPWKYLRATKPNLS